MEALELLCYRVQRLNASYIINKILANKDVQFYIKELNRTNQLYNEGIDALGKSLGIYADRTIQIKESKGQPTDRVTLRDEGDFYRSFTIKLGEKEFEINADTEKDNMDLAEVYGPILGLTKESITLLIDVLMERIKPILLNAILNG